MANYANPSVLVETQWVADHSNDSGLRVVESNEDILLYDVGHVAGSVKIDWHADLNDRQVRDYIDAADFEQLMSRFGISNDTTIVFYGDRHNWWACYAYWVFRLFGHENMKIMNGGRKKWIDEARPLSKDVPSYSGTSYKVKSTHREIRAFRDDVLDHIGRPNPRAKNVQLPAGRGLVDVRSPGEYGGTLLHMPDYPQEGAMRGGHVPGAQNIPWAQAMRAEDSTFKSADEITQLYEGKGITPEKDVVVYCRIGERSSLTWFVLHELMGYPNVRNYDGSWTEWGNVVGLPIENPAAQAAG